MAHCELKLGLNLQNLQAKLAQVMPGVKDLAQNMEAAFNKSLGAGTAGLDDWKAKLKSLGDEVAAFSARFKTMLSSLSQAGAQDEAVAAAKISAGLQAPAQPQKPMTYEEQITAALNQSRGAAGAASDAKASATEAAKAAATTATAATAADQASVNLGEGLSQAIATATGAVNNLTAQSGQLNTVTQLVPRMAESLTAMVAETKAYAEKMNDFAGVVLDKAGQTAAALRRHGAALVDYGVRLGKIEMGGRDDASLAAAGLGG